VTIVRAHQHSAGARKKASKRSADRAADQVPKIRALGNPAKLMLTPRQANDLVCGRAAVSDSDPAALIGDKECDALI
jgi:hypothetical protein